MVAQPLTPTLEKKTTTEHQCSNLHQRQLKSIEKLKQITANLSKVNSVAKDILKHQLMINPNNQKMVLHDSKEDDDSLNPMVNVSIMKQRSKNIKFQKIQNKSSLEQFETDNDLFREKYLKHFGNEGPQTTLKHMKKTNLLMEQPILNLCKVSRSRDTKMTTSSKGDASPCNTKKSLRKEINILNFQTSETAERHGTNSLLISEYHRDSSEKEVQQPIIEQVLSDNIQTEKVFRDTLIQSMNFPLSRYHNFKGSIFADQIKESPLNSTAFKNSHRQVFSNTNFPFNYTRPDNLSPINFQNFTLEKVELKKAEEHDAISEKNMAACGVKSLYDLLNTNMYTEEDEGLLASKDVEYTNLITNSAELQQHLNRGMSTTYQKQVESEIMKGTALSSKAKLEISKQLNNSQNKMIKFNVKSINNNNHYSLENVLSPKDLKSNLICKRPKKK